MTEGSEELDKLQRHKLALEIADLRRPAWLKPAMVTPIVAAVMSIALGHFSGWFDLQSTRLENQRFELTRDIEKFENERKRSERELKTAQRELKTEQDKLRAVSDQLGLAQKELSEMRQSLTTSTQNHIKEVRELKDTIATLKAALERASADGDREAQDRIARELDAAEKSLGSTQAEALDVINKIRLVFDIPESTLDDWEQEIKAEIYQTENVDEDGCFISSIDGMQHCLNY